MEPPECLTGSGLSWLLRCQPCKSWAEIKHQPALMELPSLDGCLTPFLGDFLLILMLKPRKIKNCNHHPCSIIPSLWLFSRKTERKSCDIIDPLSSQITIPRPQCLVRPLTFQSRCCLSENWSARENTQTAVMGPTLSARNQHKVRPLLSSALVSGVASSPPVLWMWAGLGWAGKYS